MGCIISAWMSRGSLRLPPRWRRAASACSTPELPDIKDYHVGANSIATIGDSAKWLATQNHGKPVGVMGLSFSGGLSLLAAADPVYRPSIRFVVAVGSQDAMSRVAAYYRTGEDARPGRHGRDAAAA